MKRDRRLVESRAAVEGKSDTGARFLSGAHQELAGISPLAGGASSLSGVGADLGVSGGKRFPGSGLNQPLPWPKIGARVQPGAGTCRAYERGGVPRVSGRAGLAGGGGGSGGARPVRAPGLVPWVHRGLCRGREGGRLSARVDITPGCPAPGARRMRWPDQGRPPWITAGRPEFRPGTPDSGSPPPIPVGRPGYQSPRQITVSRAGLWSAGSDYGRPCQSRQTTTASSSASGEARCPTTSWRMARGTWEGGRSRVSWIARTRAFSL